jgi:hypothetical protein
MTTHSTSTCRLTRYTLVVAVTAAIAVAGSVWAKSNGQQAGAAPERNRIDISALLSDAEIANLPVLNVEQAF